MLVNEVAHLLRSKHNAEQRILIDGSVVLPVRTNLVMIDRDCVTRPIEILTGG